MHIHPVIVNFFDPRPHNEGLAETERTLILDMGGLYDPTEPQFKEFLHGHLVATFHLIVSGGQDIVKISAVMDMLVHVDIIRPDLELGFKSGIGGYHRESFMFWGIQISRMKCEKARKQKKRPSKWGVLVMKRQKD
jgi:hypothetical protein